jgi:hypothetical protein
MERSEQTRWIGRKWLMGGGALVALSLVGCAEGGSMSSVPPVQAQVSAAVTVCNQTPQGCAPASSFSLGTIRDLAIHVEWANVEAGTRVQKLQLLDPGGGSYQVVNSSFEVPDGGTGTAATNVSIPISGSMITQRQITGAWTIRVSLDGQDIASQNVAFQP